MSETIVTWYSTITEELSTFKRRAIEGGKENDSPVWVIRGTLHGDVLPGKIIVNSHEASVAWGGKCYNLNEIQVGCADKNTITWVADKNGTVPSSAIVAGYIRGTGEQLYVGRGRHMDQLIPGKIEPSQGVCYITFEGEVIKLKNYEVLCRV